LKLCGIPGRIENDHTIFGNQVHAIGRHPGILILIVGGINVKVSGEMGNDQFVVGGLCVQTEKGKTKE
jgi:hypothetical protein